MDAIVVNFNASFYDVVVWVYEIKKLQLCMCVFTYKTCV